MTSDDMKVSKGLEFRVVALPGVGHMPAKGEDEQEAARVSSAMRACYRHVSELLSQNKNPTAVRLNFGIVGRRMSLRAR